MRDKGILLVISGFAGTGKGTLVRELVQRYDRYALSVSATTRAPRQGEVDGVHYFFHTVEEFEEMIAQNQLIEYARYVDHYYGTPKAYVEQQLDAGRDVILEIEIQGALKIRAQRPDTLLLFLVPPDADTLEGRLRSRATETESEIKKRLNRAVEEAEYIGQYDYVIVNDDLEECIRRTHEIIQAEHDRVSRNQEFVRKLKQELQKFHLEEQEEEVWERQKPL